MNTTNAVINQSYKSLREFAYANAGHDDQNVIDAQWALDNIKGFPSAINDTDKDELITGYKERYSKVIDKPTTYAVIGEHLVIPTPEQLTDKKVEKVIFSYEIAVNYTPHEMGKMRIASPNKHKILATLREKGSTYASNKLKALIVKANAIVNDGKGRQRGETAEFTARVSKTLKDLQDKCKTANSRGDPTADQALFSKATLAFLKVWNHQ